MPAKTKQLNIINTVTLYEDILKTFDSVVIDLGYDLNNPEDRKAISHSEINYCFRQVSYKLFKANRTLINNQNSVIDYDNIEMLSIIANAFIEICQRFNKSLGLMSYSFLLGCDYSTIWRWLQDETLNPERCKLLKNVQECHKVQQIGLLNDTPVGALAVANNDHETGLEWSKNQMQVTAQSVYFLPSERVDRMRLAKPEENNDSV